MTAFDQVFYPIFGVGCVIAAIASLSAGFLVARRGAIVIPLVALVVGVVAFWIALFIGAEVGYQTWQSIPDPPDEAFSDTAPLGALLFGWLPGAAFCMILFGFAFLVTWLIGQLRPDRRSSGSDDAVLIESVETGNPYQAPNSHSESRSLRTDGR